MLIKVKINIPYLERLLVFRSFICKPLNKEPIKK